MDTTEYTIAASMHYGQAKVGWENGDADSVDFVVEANTWAINAGHIEPYAGFLPDFEQILNTDDAIARAYCYEFDVNLLDYSEAIESELDAV